MNTKIKELEALLNSTKVSTREQVSAVEVKLNAEWALVFEKDATLKKDIEKVECSSAYGRDDGGIYTWVRMDYDVPKEESAKAALEEYVQGYGFTYQEEHDALVSYQGECIIISESDGWRNRGGVFLSDGTGHSEQIIDPKEYCSDEGEDEEERNRLIEAWMERKGFFPSVLRETRSGDLFTVDTQYKKEKKS